MKGNKGHPPQTTPQQGSHHVKHKPTLTPTTISKGGNTLAQARRQTSGK